MRVCGVDLVGNDAVICLLGKQGQMFDLIECRVRKLSVPKQHQREDIQQFQFAFAKLMEDYQVKNVAIKERQTKGKFAGGAVSFKLEAAIQLIESIDVGLLSQTQIKHIHSEHPLPIAFADTGLKAFQETAFNIAYAAHYDD